MNLEQALLAGDGRPWVIAQLLSMDTVNKRAHVSIDGGSDVALPYVDGGLSYAGYTTVLVLRDPTGSGCGQIVQGPIGTQALPPAPPPAQPPPSTPSTKQVKVTIRPSDSGTWSNKWGAFDKWYTSLGSTTLWQGNDFGSGVLEGIAVYGNQVKGLNALSIDAMTLHVPLRHGSGTVQVQETSQGSLANPSPSGATASGTDTIALGSTIRENFRTGATKGLCLVGGTYLAVWGTAKASGMALSITYTRAA